MRHKYYWDISSTYSVKLRRERTVLLGLKESLYKPSASDMSSLYLIDLSSLKAKYMGLQVDTIGALISK